MILKNLKYVLLVLLYNGYAISNAPKITVFVHGTLPPLVDKLHYKLDIPKGLTRADKLKDPIFQGKFTSILSESDSHDFPLEHSYVFGWSGALSRKTRIKAAKELYHELKKLDGDITVIGHSHGGNVSLNLAKIAKKYKDTKFKVDRLILLGTPIQSATKKYVKSKTFNEIYSFYSPVDWFQAADPQGLYSGKKTPFFSERRWPKKYNISQIRVSFNGKDAWHVDFICEKFIRNLSMALSMAKNYKQIHEECDVRFNIK